MVFTAITQTSRHVAYPENKISNETFCEIQRVTLYVEKKNRVKKQDQKRYYWLFCVCV